MSPNFRIAFRFLTAKKRAMTMSLACTILGVGLFIVTQATTSGFEDFFIKTILGTNGAMVVADEIQDTIRQLKTSEDSDMTISAREEGRKYIEGVQEPKLIIDALKSFANVSGASPVLHGNIQVRSSFKNETAQVYGIELDEHLKVSDLKSQIRSGSLDEFRDKPNGVLVGKELADRLRLQIDSSILLDAINNSPPRRYRVCAIYETGVSDIDKTRIYMRLTEARSLLKRPTGVSFVQLNLYDPSRAPEDSVQMEEVLKHSAKPWQVREKTWLEVFRALRISTAITVSVFTLIAGLAMYNTLALIVMEKTKDIAILRSMGYTRDDISRIFIWQAGIVLVIGSIGGALFGAGVTYAVSRMPLRITGIFKTEHFLTHSLPWHYAAAITIASVMVMVASLLPARRAARLEPGDIIRGTAQ
jgi:lipoprotein-releasing system permease protein